MKEEAEQREPQMMRSEFSAPECCILQIFLRQIKHLLSLQLTPPRERNIMRWPSRKEPVFIPRPDYNGFRRQKPCNTLYVEERLLHAQA